MKYITLKLLRACAFHNNKTRAGESWPAVASCAACLMSSKERNGNKFNKEEIMKEMYITHDGRRTNKSNLRLLSNNGLTVLMSYATPVAFMDERDESKCWRWFFTSHKYSPTTSKQITRFLNSWGTSRDKSIEVAQCHIDSAYKNMAYDDNNSLLSERCYYN